MEYVYGYILFLVQVATIAGAILFVVAGLFRLKGSKKGHLEITDITSEYKEQTQSMKQALFSEKYLEKEAKKDKKKEKQAAKKNKNSTGRKSTVFVVDFKGSVMAEEVEALRHEITAILSVANKNDEIVINVESPGGAVFGYGLASSQLDRIRQKGIKLTVCVDKVAASGGYLMACVADKIIAAPYSYIGSIGVVMGVPNLHKLLKKNDVDYEMITAGKYKRTVTMLGENTPEAIEKKKEELEEIHDIFKATISKYRPQVDMDKVATGEAWLATKAIEFDLVDEIGTSDEYILGQVTKDKSVVKVAYDIPQPIAKKLLKSASSEAEGLFTRVTHNKNTPMA